MGNASFYSYGDIGDGQFGSSAFQHYDHKEGGTVTHNDFQNTVNRSAGGGSGGNGGMGPKQSTGQQSYATPYKYTLYTPRCIE